MRLRRGIPAMIAALIVATGGVALGATAASTRSAASHAGSLPLSSPVPLPSLPSSRPAPALTPTPAAAPGGYSGPAGVPTGTYQLTTRLMGNGGRGGLAIDGAPVWAGQIAATGQSLVVPVHVAGPASRITTSVPVAGGVHLSPAPPQYTVAGNQILDQNGNPVIFRGVNRNGLDYKPTLYWGGWNDIAAMGDWGASIVRLELSEDFWLPQSCLYDPNYAKLVDAEVTMIHAKGMVALLDLHSSLSTTICPSAPQRQPMADSHALDFWRSVAARYKDQPYVAFDLFNEPVNVSPQVWRNGGAMHGWQAAGMQQMYDAVRATGATNLVFVSGLQFAFDLTPALLDPLDGYGIVFAPHVYYDGACSIMDPRAPSVWGPVGAVYPIVITEFGTPCPTGIYPASVIAYAELHHYGWIAYLWADHANGGSVRDARVDADSRTEPAGPARRSRSPARTGLGDTRRSLTGHSHPKAADVATPPAPPVPDHTARRIRHRVSVAAQHPIVQAALWRAQGWTSLGGR